MGKGFACGSMGDCNFRHFYENLLDEWHRRWLSTLIYVGMGWLAVAAFIPLKRAIGWGGLGMLLAGGIVYTIGAVIYALKKPNLAILKSFGFQRFSMYS